MLNEKRVTGVLAVFFVMLSLGFVVHRSPTFAGGFMGHLIGMAGALLMCLALLYPFRKRVLKKRGKSNPLNRHIYYGLIGPSLVVIHAAHKFSNLIGVITFLSMFLIVLSGIVGRFLFGRVNRTLKEQQHDLSLLKARFELEKENTKLLRACLIRAETEDGEGSGLDAFEDEKAEWEMDAKCERLIGLAHSLAETEYVVKAFSGTKRLFSRWLRLHYMLALLLFSMMTVHVLTTLYYGLRWLR
jgi:hypothetical protein